MNRDELKDLWRLEARQSTNKEIEMIVEKIEAKTQKLDRRILRREIVECMAAAVVAAFFAAQAVQAPPGMPKWGLYWLSASGIWMIFYVLKYGKGPQSPAPTGDLAAYRSAIAAKYDHQIRLLKRVKYWYLLPPYVGMLMLYAGVIHKSPPQMPSILAGFAGTTAFFGFVWWLNEGWGARRLRQERDEVTGLLKSE